MYDKRMYRIGMYIVLGMSIVAIIMQGARLFYSNRNAERQKLFLEQERIQHKILTQYPDAVHYINTHVHTDDFSSMLNFRLHDQPYIKILLSKDEIQTGRYKRRVQISAHNINTCSQILENIMHIESSICHVDKISYEKRKDGMMLTVDLMYIHE